MLPAAFISGVIVGYLAGRSLNRLYFYGFIAKAVELGLITLHPDKLEELKKKGVK